MTEYSRGVASCTCHDREWSMSLPISVIHMPSIPGKLVITTASPNTTKPGNSHAECHTLIPIGRISQVEDHRTAYRPVENSMYLIKDSVYL
jgi:hypothetical protein